MNIQEFKKVYPFLRKHKVTPFLWGNEGVGKTQIVGQIAKSLDTGLVHLYLATQDVGDLIGLLKHNPDGSVSHSKPSWFPTQGNGIIFLDEANRCHPDVMQAMFSFITRGMLHEHVLPQGWTIIAAGNYDNEDFNVTSTSDAAWLSRFCHIDFQPTTEEFVLYAENKEAYDVAGFIRENADCLERANKKDNLNFITPDRRAWLEMVSPLDNEDEIENEKFELFKGCVGQAAASSYMTYKKKKEKAVSAGQIINNYEKVRETILTLSNPENVRLDMITKTCNELIARIKTDDEFLKDETKLNNVFQFVLDIPRESSLTFINEIVKTTSVNKGLILNNKNFSNRMKVRILEK
jgi:alkaline phosphatase D